MFLFLVCSGLPTPVVHSTWSQGGGSPPRRSSSSSCIMYIVAACFCFLSFESSELYCCQDLEAWKREFRRLRKVATVLFHVFIFSCSLESWEPFVRRHFFVCFSRRDWKVPACAVWSFSVCSQYRLPGILRRLDLFVWVWFWFGLSVCRRVACAGNSDC